MRISVLSSKVFQDIKAVANLRSYMSFMVYNLLKMIVCCLLNNNGWSIKCKIDQLEMMEH